MSGGFPHCAQSNGSGPTCVHCDGPGPPECDAAADCADASCGDATPVCYELVFECAYCPGVYEGDCGTGIGAAVPYGRCGCTP